MLARVQPYRSYQKTVLRYYCTKFQLKSLFVGHEDEIYAKLKNASVNNHFSVYKKSEYPERWHYKNNERSPPILVLADFGYALDDLIIAAPRYAKRYNFKRNFF